MELMVNKSLKRQQKASIKLLKINNRNNIDPRLYPCDAPEAVKLFKQNKLISFF